eukprot:5385440-Amphidinium_carterae.1
MAVPLVVQADTVLHHHIITCVDWLMEYGPFDVALLSMTPGDDDLTSKVIVPEGTTRQRVMAWSESTCLGMGLLNLQKSMHAA